MNTEVQSIFSPDPHKLISNLIILRSNVFLGAGNPCEMGVASAEDVYRV